MEARTETTGTPSERSDRNPVHRVLLVADEIFDGGDVARELEKHLGADAAGSDVLVISPAMSHSRIDQELGNVDPVLPEADDRMVAAVKELSDAGFRARGEVGDGDLLVAIGDGIAEYRPDEIVVVVHVDDEADPGEKGIWTRLKDEFHEPVTLLKVAHPDARGASVVVDSEHSPAHDRTSEEVIRETRNFPPLRGRDVAGILIGFIGTIALGMIAVAAGTDDSGELSGSAAVILMIAMAAFLINVAHIVGLLFFESVRYTGIWEKFMARASILITTVGLAVSLILWLA